MQWEARYAAVDRLWSGDPNDWLPEFALGWEPGRALDLGCGEGADAVWLAEHGWDVTGLDLSATAIARMRARARDRGLAGATKGWQVEVAQERWREVPGPDGEAGRRSDAVICLRRPV